MAEFEDRADYGDSGDSEDRRYDTPPAPWEYEPELPPEIEQGENRPVTDPSDYETQNWDSGEQPGDESTKWWVQNWAASDNDGEQPGDESSKDWVGNWTPPDDGRESDDRDNPELAYSHNWNAGADYNPYPAQDYSSETLGNNPELVYYGAYQPGSPYYGVSQFKAGGGGLSTPSEEAGADDGNAMGQTSQGTSEGVRQPEVGDGSLTQADAPWYDSESGRWIQPDSIVPDVRNPSPNRNPYVNNNPVNPAHPSGPAIPEGLWASVQHAWRMLTDPRYARSQAFGGYVDPSGGQFANRDRWPTSPGDLIEEASRSTTQANKFTLGPPLDPEVAKALERATKLGLWMAENTDPGDRSWVYQGYVTGRPGEAFEHNGVRFDGVADSALLEAKGYYRDFIDPKTGDFYDWYYASDSGVEDLISQAKRQVQAAEGAPIEWHFNEEDVMDLVSQLFKNEGLRGIKLVYDPLPKGED